MKSWSLNKKIYLIIGMAIVSLFSVGGVGIYQMGKIQDSLELIALNYTRNQNDIANLKSAYMEQVIQARNLLIAINKTYLDEYHANLNLNDEKVREAVEGLLSRSKLPENRKNLLAFQKGYEDWRNLVEKTYQHIEDNDKAAANELTFGAQRKLNFENQDALNAVLKVIMNLTSEAVSKAQADYAEAKFLVFSIIGLAIALSLGLSLYLLKMIDRSISGVISGLTENSHQVTSASQQIASSSEELSQASTEQAASLEQTAASIEELTSMVQKNAENSKRAYEISNHSTQSAQKGKIVVGDMMKAIDDISVSNADIMRQVEEGNQKISDIVNVIAEIGNKTKVINDIVFQTKLLSFNASVEAARAGEHGKGFAVVAEEVGNLAQMSGNAAKEISSMLESSIQKVESIVTETKQKVSALVLEGKKCVESGTQIASECGEVLEEIVEKITSVAEMSHEISMACDEQAQGVQEITRAMGQLDQVTQTNAATSEESASAAEQLSAQAEALNSSIGVLFKEIYGQKAEMSTAAFTAKEGTKETPVAQKKYAIERTNVINLRQDKKPARPAQAPQQKLKKVAGGFEGKIPAEDDPRFEEV